ncbi:MAG: response regulator [Anaerolineales bacterium]|nr:response regulator [Anaerolineales bacterium]
MTDLAYVIEDDEDLSMIFGEALIAANYRVETITDGLKARQRLQEEIPHLVLLDLHLPGLSGAELLAQIRADARLAKTIVVIATADARLGDALHEVADFVLVKPISFTQLRDLTTRLHNQ